MIDNPDFKEDKEMYKRDAIGYIAFEIWQVKSGSIFDNIMLTSSKQEALDFAQATWGKSIEQEREMKAAFEVLSLRCYPPRVVWLDTCSKHTARQAPRYQCHVGVCRMRS